MKQQSLYIGALFRKESRITAILFFLNIIAFVAILTAVVLHFSTMDDVVDVSRLTICLENRQTIYA